MRLLFTIVLGFAFSLIMNAQSANFWQDAIEQNVSLEKDAERRIIPQKYRTLSLDLAGLKSELATAPYQRTAAAKNNPLIVNLPMPDGSTEAFAIWESPVMNSGLAAKFPYIKTYAGQSLRHPSDLLRMGYGATGFYATINAEAGQVYIDPYATKQEKHYISYYTKDHVDQTRAESFKCGVNHDEHVEFLAEMDYKMKQNRHKHKVEAESRSAATIDYREYDMAMSTTAEYAAFHGGTLASVMSELTILMNRVNMIMERELAIHFNLVDDNDLLIHFNTATDGYTHGDVPALFQQNPTVINAVISPNDYDIGHVVGVATAGGTVGLAALGSVCNPNRKANGVSTIFQPIGDNFYVDILSHELGHQLGGPHTFNHCDMDNESPTTAFEPGSGSTIMSYSGSCGSNNLQFDSDDYFNIGALELMKFYMHEDEGNTCATRTALTNNEPVVDIPLEDGFYIPIETPFELPGAATDADGDNIRYCWEQYDLGPLINVGQATIGNPPIIRSYPPTSTPNRIVPPMNNIISGNNVFGIDLPTYSRNMTFRLVVRDYNADGGATHWDEVKFKSDADSGPFRVFVPTNATHIWEVGQYTEVVWNVANTDGGLVNSPFVDITLSTDGGLTYPITILANTPNDGSEFITVPDHVGTTARVKIKGSNNIFFDISNFNFPINAPSAPGYSLTVSPLEQQVCLPATAEIDLATTSLLGYTGMVDFSVISGLPTGATTSYDVNPAPPTDGATLSIDMSNVTDEGQYDVVIQAIGTNQDTSLRTVRLDVVSNDFSALALTAPADAAQGESTLPTFDWVLVDDADTYIIEIATDAAFANIVDMSAGVMTNNYTPGITLEEDTEYFWRVTPVNACGNGPTTGAFSFETLALTCAINTSIDTPIAIPSSGVPTVESKLNITAIGEISDLNIKSIKGNHEYMGELTMSLISPAGTEVVLLSNKCLNYNGPFDFGIDDQAPTGFQCPPNSGLSYQAAGSLADFNGEDTEGEWKLKIADNNGGSGGQITSWEIEFCGLLMTSAEDIEIANAINVFPNPVDDIVNIQFENSVTNSVDIRLMDVTGRLLKTIQQNQADNVISINTKQLAAGVYFLHIQLEDKVITKKFSKQ